VAAGIAFLAFHGANRNELTGGAIGSAVLLLALSGLAAYPVARRLQRTISIPLIQLAQTAKAVTLFQDYSLRARKSGEDELGMLIDAFDEMLASIQETRADCERQRGVLEDEVCARTGELRTVKAQLHQSRERAAAGQAQSRFLADTCHQIRTPMNGILGMTELALDTPLSAEQHGYLLMVKDSAESLLTILEGVLGASETGFPPPATTRQSSGIPASDLHVLVVEDHPVNQKLVRTLLGKHGHQARVAGNGREALEVLAGEGFDAILMDLQMPEMSGFEATRAIRRSERGSGRHIPIIAMTAHTLKGDRERCLACGMDAYLPKPIRPDALLDALERACALQLPS
jgi:CheY-like chemotaxis protein